MGGVITLNRCVSDVDVVAVMVHEPAVLIEGVLFRARYLGSTQLVCEGRPSKTTRMMQAQEAVARIKASRARISTGCPCSIDHAALIFARTLINFAILAVILNDNRVGILGSGGCQPSPGIASLVRDMVSEAFFYKIACNRIKSLHCTERNALMYTPIHADVNIVHVL